MPSWLGRLFGRTLAGPVWIEAAELRWLEVAEMAEQLAK